MVAGAQGIDVTHALDKQLDALRQELPVGYRIQVGGTVEESAKGQNSINAQMPIMLVVVLTLLMVQLQSFSRVMMVVLTAPLGLIGVVATLLLFGQPFGFVAMLGVIAMFGIIMRNSVILVDQIEQDIGAGHQRIDAIVGATVRRFRPITLTAAAAVLALIPLLRSNFRPHGHRADGRHHERHRAHPVLPAGALCRLVPGETRRARGSTTMTTVKSPRIPVRLTILPLVLALGACAFAPDRKPPAAPQPAQYGVQPLPAAGPRRKAWPSTMNRAPSRCRNGGSAMARPSWTRWSRKAWRKPGPGRHRPLAGRGPRAAARPDQLVPDAQRGRRRRVSRKRALTMPGLPDPTKLYNIYTGQIQARYEVDIFGAARFANEAESARVEQRAFQLDSARRALAANIVTGAIRSAALAERVALTEKQAVLSRQVARDAQRRYELGSASQSEALDADRDAANLEASLPGLYAEWQSIRHALAVLLGRTPDQAPPDLAFGALTLPAQVPVLVPSDLLASRPDIPRGGNGGACSRR